MNYYEELSLIVRASVKKLSEDDRVEDEDSSMLSFFIFMAYLINFYFP